MIVLIGYIVSIVLFRYKKFSFLDSLVLSFLVYFVITYNVIMLLNLLGVSNFFLAVLISLLLIFFIIKLNLLKKYNLSFDRKLFFLPVLIILLAIIGFFGQDYVYDDKSYHIDIVWNLFINQNVFNGFLHYWSVYPKFGDFINGTFGYIFKDIDIFSFYLGNVFVIIILSILVYNFAKIFLSNKKLLVLFTYTFVLSPLLLYQSLSGLVDMTFFLFILYSFYFFFKELNYSNFFLFILSIIALINIKYSGPFLGGLISLLYLFYHFKEFKLNKKYFLLGLLFIPGFAYYFHNYYVYKTFLYPFYSLHDLKVFFQTLPHAPKHINGIWYKEIYYANFEKPLLKVLDNLQNIHSIKDLYLLDISLAYNNYGLFWIVAFFSIIFGIVLAFLKKDSKLLFLALMILLLYFIQSTKWENRYFIHFMLLGYLMLFYCLSYVQANKFKTFLLYLFIFQIFVSYIAILYHRFIVNIYYPTKNYEKIQFYKNSEFTYLYFWYLFIKGKKLDIINNVIKSCDNKVIIYTPNRNSIRGKIECKNVVYIPNLGYEIKN